jgi:hypothetical protein
MYSKRPNADIERSNMRQLWKWFQFVSKIVAGAVLCVWPTVRATAGRLSLSFKHIRAVSHNVAAAAAYVGVLYAQDKHNYCI